MSDLYCLTLRQPWASLIALGEKRIETRDWGTSYRGMVAIHASGRWHYEDVEDAVYEASFLAAWKRRGIRAMAELPLGAVVATARLIDCVRMTPGMIAAVEPNEMHFGYFAPGRWGWLLADVRALPDPIPAKGRLGLWTPSPELAASVAAQSGLVTA